MSSSSTPVLKSFRYVAYSAFGSSLILPLTIILFMMKLPEPVGKMILIGDGLLLGLICLSGFVYGILGSIYALVKLKGSGSRGYWFAVAAMMNPIISVALFFLGFALFGRP